jgi:hypothetical protein
MDSRKIYKVLLTGGPCGGKTTSINRLKTILSEKFDVYVVRELGEFMATVGVVFEPLSEITREYKKNFWDSQLGIQICLEDNLRFFFQNNSRDVIILCDRGLWDCFAFGPGELRHEYLTESNQSRQELLVDRYDLVVVMVSSAFGIPDIYGLDNNVLRSENLQEAIDLEKRILDIYAGHPSMFLVDNFVKNIDIKIGRTCDGITRFVRGENPLITMQKYLIRSQESVDSLAKAIPFLKKFSVSEKHIFLEPSDKYFTMKIIKRRFADDHQTSEVNWLVTKEERSSRSQRVKISETDFKNKQDSGKSPSHSEIDKTITVFIDLREDGIYNIWEIHSVHLKSGVMNFLKAKRDFEYPATITPPVIDFYDCFDIFGKAEFSTEILARGN